MLYVLYLIAVFVIVVCCSLLMLYICATSLCLYIYLYMFVFDCLYLATVCVSNWLSIYFCVFICMSVQLFVCLACVRRRCDCVATLARQRSQQTVLIHRHTQTHIHLTHLPNVKDNHASTYTDCI